MAHEHDIPTKHPLSEEQPTDGDLAGGGEPLTETPFFSVDHSILDQLTDHLASRLVLDHDSASTSSSISTPPTTPPPRASLLRPFHPIPASQSQPPRPSRATVWQVPFDSIEWETEVGRRATAFITLPIDQSVCYQSGAIHHGFLSSLCHEMAQRCCEDGTLVAMNLDYRGSAVPGETVILTVRTARLDPHQQWLSCQINKAADIIVSGEAIFSRSSRTDAGHKNEGQHEPETHPASLYQETA